MTAQLEHTDAGPIIDGLLRGNGRFCVGESDHCADRVERRLAFLDAQNPSVAVLSCADARVDPDIVFDAPLGDLFSVRIAGALATAEAIASLKYAVDALGVRTVVVLGHEGCGAVAAAVAGNAPAALEPLVAPIRSVLFDSTDPVRDNTCAQAHRVRAELDPSVTVLGAVYSAETGRVEVHAVPVGDRDPLPVPATRPPTPEPPPREDPLT
jgi:carbonic anhydrase